MEEKEFCRCRSKKTRDVRRGEVIDPFDVPEEEHQPGIQSIHSISSWSTLTNPMLYGESTLG